MAVRFPAGPYTLWVLDVGLACCAVEVVAASMRVAADEQARPPDVMVVAGTLTDKMAPAIKDLYDSLPDPKYVISFGACSNCGGPYWDSYSVTKGVDQIVPVDVYVPGCPPRPEALLDGLRRLEALGVTPEGLGDHLVRLIGDATATVGFGQLTVDVPAAGWVAAATVARDDPDGDLSCFDWLSAVDELEAGFDVVLHVYSVAHKHRALLRTRVPRSRPVLASLAGVFPGAGWHERETHEMFGIGFDGHPGLAPLLLPDGFEGHPLRKDFLLAARLAKQWPGEKEPGESQPSRRRLRPPGVPENWGQA